MYFRFGPAYGRVGENMTDDAKLLSVRNLYVSVEGKEIVKGVDLDVGAGEIHAIMGPNGSGKSTLAAAIMGHPAYEVTGEIYLDGEAIHDLDVHERARKGVFLGFQYPTTIPGVAVGNFLRAALTAKEGDLSIPDFRRRLMQAFDELSVPKAFAARSVNDGFSGGEKKRLETLQMRLLAPRFALLDETDSGLDIDALKIVSDGINRVMSDEMGLVMVTHYQRILDYVKPDKVHVFMDGRIVRSGGPELARELEARGYDWLTPAAAVGGAA